MIKKIKQWLLIRKIKKELKKPKGYIY